MHTRAPLPPPPPPARSCAAPCSNAAVASGASANPERAQPRARFAASRAENLPGSWWTVAWICSSSIRPPPLPVQMSLLLLLLVLLLLLLLLLLLPARAS
jgi:hypothetical protein